MKLTQLVGQFSDRVSQPADEHENYVSRIGSGSNGSAGFNDILSKFIQTDGGIYNHTVGQWAPDSSVDPRIYDSSLSVVSEDFVAVDSSLGGTEIEAFIGFSAYFDELDFSTRTGIGFHATGGTWWIEARVSPDSISAENVQLLRYRDTGALTDDHHLLKVVANARTRTVEWWVDGVLFDWVTPAEPIGGWGLAKSLFLRHEIKTTSGSARLFFGAPGLTFLAVGEPETADLVTGSVQQPEISATGVTNTFVRLLGSAYVEIGVAGDHMFSKWQIATEPTFADPVVFDSDWTPSNLVLQDHTGLAAATTYYARVIYRSRKCYESSWSLGVEFTTAAAPAEGDPTQNPSTPWGPDEAPCEPHDPPPDTQWVKSGRC